MKEEKDIFFYLSHSLNFFFFKNLLRFAVGVVDVAAMHARKGGVAPVN